MPLPESCKETTGSFVFQGFPCEGHVFAFQIGIPTDHPIPAESLLHSAPALALSCKACRFHKILRPDRPSFDFVGCPADRWKKAHTISTSPERLFWDMPVVPSIVTGPFPERSISPISSSRSITKPRRRKACCQRWIEPEVPGSCLPCLGGIMIVQFAGAMSVPDDLAAYLLVSGGPTPS